MSKYPAIGTVYHASLDDVIEIPGFNVRDLNQAGVPELNDLYPQVIASRGVTQPGKAFVEGDKLNLITSHRRRWCLLAAQDVAAGMPIAQWLAKYGPSKGVTKGLTETMYKNTQGLDIDMRLPLIISPKESPLARHIDNIRSNTIKPLTSEEQGRAFLYVHENMTYADWMKQTKKPLPAKPKGLTLDSRLLARDIAELFGYSQAHVSQCSALIPSDKDSAGMYAVKETLLELTHDASSSFNSNDARKIIVLARQQETLQLPINAAWAIEQATFLLDSRAKAAEKSRQAALDKAQGASDDTTPPAITLADPADKTEPTTKDLDETKHASDNSLVTDERKSEIRLPDSVLRTPARVENDKALLMRILALHGVEFVLTVVEQFKASIAPKAAPETASAPAPATTTPTPAHGPKPGRQAARPASSAKSARKAARKTAA